MRLTASRLRPRVRRAVLEQRYRRLPRLYPHEFRARRADEMLGVLMAGAGTGQDKPARSDVSAIVRSSLLGAAVVNLLSPPIGRLAQLAIGPMPALVAHADILATLFLPPLLVLAWAVAQATRARRTPDRGDLAA